MARNHITIASQGATKATGPMFSAKAITEVGFCPNSPSTPVGKGKTQGHERQVDDGQGEEAAVDPSGHDLKRWCAIR